MGTHRLTNVPASVGPATGELLLGQSFLSRFRSWTFDNSRHALVLTEQYASKANAASPIYRTPLLPTASALSVGTAVGLANAAREEFFERRAACV